MPSYRISFTELERWNKIRYRANIPDLNLEQANKILNKITAEQRVAIFNYITDTPNIQIEFLMKLKSE